MTAITGLRGLTLDPSGNEVFSKDADTVQPTASMAKVVAAYTARQLIGDMQATITVAAGDLIGGSTAGLQAGDMLTYEDALYGMMLPSGNDAAWAVGRTLGVQLLQAEGSGSTDGIPRFAAEMVATMSALGWSGHGFATPAGVWETDRCTMRQMCHLMRHIDHTDPVLRAIMGTLTKVITITGPNARTIGLTHTINPSGATPLPEFVAGKTGTTTPGGACVVALWDHEGGRYVSGIMHSTPADRFRDLRAIMDHAIANPAPTRRRGASLVGLI